MKFRVTISFILKQTEEVKLGEIYKIIGKCEIFGVKKTPKEGRLLGAPSIKFIESFLFFFLAGNALFFFCRQFRP